MPGSEMPLTFIPASLAKQETDAKLEALDKEYDDAEAKENEMYNQFETDNQFESDFGNLWVGDHGPRTHKHFFSQQYWNPLRGSWIPS